MIYSPFSKGSTPQEGGIFLPDGHDKTFAEMGRAEKNALSMRRLAVNQLAAFLAH